MKKKKKRWILTSSEPPSLRQKKEKSIFFFFFFNDHFPYLLIDRKLQLGADVKCSWLNVVTSYEAAVGKIFTLQARTLNALHNRTNWWQVADIGYPLLLNIISRMNVKMTERGWNIFVPRALSTMNSGNCWSCFMQLETSTPLCC